MDGNQQLVKRMQQQSRLKTEVIAEAFLAVDRADFVPLALQDSAYEDRPLPIGHGQTISQPSTVAFMLEQLAPQAGDKVLDVGTGSGWTTALLAEIVGPKGAVYGVELIPELVKSGSDNLAKYRYAQARIQPAGKQVGLKKQAPFDKILVSAAAKDKPRGLIDQLGVTGRLVVPVGSSVLVIDKIEDNLTTKEFPGFAFVPLK